MGSVRRGRQACSGSGVNALRWACAALSVAVLTPCPAAAQQQDHAFVRTEIVDTITLQNDADMDFGDIIPSASAGTVVMTPSATPTCTASPSLVPTVYLGNPGNSPNHRFQVNAPDGSYTFYVGGTLNVGANQFPGIYNGTFQIDVTYN